MGLQLEKLGLPVFDGDVRQYPRFKSDFERFVRPEMTSDQAAFVLRRSLGKKPLQIVGAIDEDVSEMWDRPTKQKRNRNSKKPTLSALYENEI